MKGGNSSPSQKMADRRTGPKPRPRKGVLMDDKAGNRGSSRRGDHCPALEFTSDGHRDPGMLDGQLSSSTWHVCPRPHPPIAPSRTGKDSCSARVHGVRVRGMFLVFNGDKFLLKVTLRNQTCLPKHRNHGKHNTLGTRVHFYTLSCSV